MLRDPYEIVAATVVPRAPADSPREASTGVRRVSAAPALGLPYGGGSQTASKAVS
jgi:hypothetical protein